MPDQFQQALAAGGRHFVEQQHQAEVQASERRAQLMGHGVEQLTLLIDVALQVAGHGVEYTGQFTDVRMRGNVRTLGHLPLAQTPGRFLEPLKVAPVRPHPQQQAAKHGGADQHSHAPGQHVDVQRVRWRVQAHQPALFQRRQHRFVIAPLADAHCVQAMRQTRLLRRAQAGLIGTQQGHLQRRERLGQLLFHRRPLLARGLAELAHDQ
ncbi:hypothetical protein D3C78_689460 [compost metagenome]